MTKKYAISKAHDVLVPANANTKNSIYPALQYKVLRRFDTRQLARQFKQSKKYPTNYAIINTATSQVVR